MYDGVIKFGGVDMIFSDSQFKHNGIICLFPIYEYSNIIMLDEHLGDLSIVVYNYCISDAGGGFGSFFGGKKGGAGGMAAGAKGLLG